MLAHTLFQKSTQALLDILFPPSCVSCKTAGSWLCQSCLNNISFISPPICEFCGTSMVSATSFCRQCHHNPLQYIDGIRATSYFENNPIRSAIHSLKYNNHKAMASILGKCLVDTYQRYNLTADVITPVTLHPSRFRERGYNQSELLATQVGNILGLPINTTTLQRTRKTESQMQLGADKRRQNVADAFACCNQELLGHAVLLIDDVCTTGSTLDACARALKQSGVASVWGVTLAKAY